MDDGISTQLRTITFSDERKGFDKREVREFLAEVAEWIEGGGGDVVRRRLERIAQKSANMLADAEDGAEGLRREAEQEARALIDNAKADADAYSGRRRSGRARTAARGPRRGNLRPRGGQPVRLRDPDQGRRVRRADPLRGEERDRRAARRLR